MNFLIFSDLHIRPRDLKECSSILDEILTLCNEHKISQVFNLGDSFDGLYPTSPELDLFSNFLMNLNKPMTILAADSHESTTFEDSIMNHFGILVNNVKIVKAYRDRDELYLGHFIVKEAKKGKFGATVSKDELKNYKKVFLGHQHSNEELGNVIQVGSVRWVSFDESEDKAKYVYIIKDYGQTSEKTLKIALKSPILMKSIYLSQTTDKVTGSEFETFTVGLARQYLDSLESQTKVRVIYKDFQAFKEFLPYYKNYEDKFILFKDKKEFLSKPSIEIAKKEKIPIEEALKKWMIEKNIDPEIQQILLEKK
jgi:DNA repair exonuclease SbcCD nuclease subunit